MDATAGKSFTIHNPASDDVVASGVQAAGKADVDQAVRAATAAFKGEWSTFTGSQRAACMQKFADLVEKDKENIATLESMAMGQPLGISCFIVQEMANTFRYYAGYADKLGGESFPEENGTYTIVRYEPLGVVAALASWNATTLYVGWKMAPALATGNCSIFKASEKSPLGALALGKHFKEAGFPPGVAQFVTGAGEVGEMLASHPDINKISFTGSAAVGRKVQNAATNSNLKRVTLELGGKSPALVFDDADFENAVNL